MRKLFGLIYEVTIDVDNEILEEFELWLADHVAKMLRLDAFRDAQVLDGEPVEAGRARRIVHYFPISEAALQEYFDADASRMRQEGIDRFGNRFSAQRRVLKDSALPSGASRPLPHCLNCDATLTGQYCGDCGQRAQSRLISIWALLKEAFGDLLEFDSRLWQTLVPLLLKPGHLTQDYLQGRRARYMPPFRMYLVLSIVFFIVAFFDSSKVFNILFPAAAETTVALPEPAVTNEVTEVHRQLIDDLQLEMITTDPDTARALREGLDDIATLPDGNQAVIRTDCKDSDLEDAPAWLKTRLTQERLNEICERVTQDGGKTLIAGLLDNVPAFLFLFLPFLALVMKVLYPLSKRYYVEHLLFVIHLHAFFFLVLTLEVLLSRGAALFTLPNVVEAVAATIAVAYPLVYTYKGMRRVYGQGRLITFAKYAVLVIAYATGFGIMIALALLFTAVSL